MNGRTLLTLLDASRAQAEINRTLKAGSVFGHIGELVAAQVTGSIRIGGTGRDLRIPMANGTRRPDPVGLRAPERVGKRNTEVPTQVPYADMASSWLPRDRARFESWIASSDQLGEVKTRQLDSRYGDQQILDTRSAGPHASFFPMVDFYVFIILDETGDIAMARRLELAEVVEYVASDVGRGGAWNYKVSIGLGMRMGEDLTEASRLALASMPIGDLSATED